MNVDSAGVSMGQRLGWTLGAAAFSRLLSALTTIYLLAVLPATSYREWGFVMAVGFNLLIFTSSGPADFLVANRTPNSDEFCQRVKEAWLVCLILGLLALFIELTLLPLLPLSGQGKNALILITLSAIVSGFNQISQAAFRARHQIAKNAYFRVLTVIFLLGGIGVAARLSDSLQAISLAYLLTSVLLFGLHLWGLGGDLLHSALRREVAFQRIQNQIVRVIPFVAVPQLQYLIPALISFLALIYLNSADAAALNAVITLYFSATMIVAALDQSYFPLLASKRLEERRTIFRHYLGVSIGIAVGSWTFLFFAADRLAQIPFVGKFAGIALLLRNFAPMLAAAFILNPLLVRNRIYSHQKWSILGLTICVLCIIIAPFVIAEPITGNDLLHFTAIGFWLGVLTCLKTGK